MKALAQFVEYVRDLAVVDAPTQATVTASFDIEHAIIQMDEVVDISFEHKAWSYYGTLVGHFPSNASDLLLGIAYVTDEDAWCLPHDHPIADLLLSNGHEPGGRTNSMLVYERSEVALGQQSLAELFRRSGKLLEDKGALWECDGTMTGE